MGEKIAVFANVKLAKMAINRNITISYRKLQEAYEYMYIGKRLQIDDQ